MKIHKLIIISGAAAIIMSLSSLGYSQGLNVCSRIKGVVYMQCNSHNYKINTGCMYRSWADIFLYVGYSTVCGFYTSKSKIGSIWIEISKGKNGGVVYNKIVNPNYNINVEPYISWSPSVEVIISGGPPSSAAIKSRP